MEDTVDLKKIFTQAVEAKWLHQKNVNLHVLRLDQIHAEISGNKWFKLKYYLEDALSVGFTTVSTFGGAYSNHILAVACACSKIGLKSMGIIRGEKSSVLSHTLLIAQQFGMELNFVSREEYRNVTAIKERFNGVYWINEGGYGAKGAQGAKEIVSFCNDAEAYSHIVCAVGTGTMMAGIVESVNVNQVVIGVSVMKGNIELMNNVTSLVDTESVAKQYSITHDYHFGGYAKHPPELIEFMNQVWQQYHLPTDIVYTAKTLFAIQELILNDTIPAGSNVLMIHSGGLQGNLSLPAGTLCF